MDISQWKGTLEFLLGTPLYLAVSLSAIIFIVYYFIKIAPKRYADYQNLSEENGKKTEILEKICNQYDKALENSSRVVENNTEALKTTQSVLKIVSEKEAINTQELLNLRSDVKELTEKVNENQISLTRISAKID